MAFQGNDIEGLGRGLRIAAGLETSTSVERCFYDGMLEPS